MGHFFGPNALNIWVKSAPKLRDLVTPPYLYQQLLKTNYAQKVPQKFWITFEPPLMEETQIKAAFFGGEAS